MDSEQQAIKGTHRAKTSIFKMHKDLWLDGETCNLAHAQYEYSQWIEHSFFYVLFGKM